MLNLNTSEKNWASTTAARFEHRLRAVRERSAEKIPNRAVDGVHNNKIFEGNRDDADGICWWTNGFWAGMLWQAYHATHDDRYAEIARFTERTLDECFSCYYGLHHDVGFMWLPSAVADYRLTATPMPAAAVCTPPNCWPGGSTRQGISARGTISPTRTPIPAAGRSSTACSIFRFCIGRARKPTTRALRKSP